MKWCACVNSVAFAVKQVTENAGNEGGASNSPPKAVVQYKVDNEGVFYQHDSQPTGESELPCALRWLSISHALHAPLEVQKQREE